MAAKEATVYVVDVGLTMGERSHGRTETNLGFALEYVWDKVLSTVATGRKTAMAGVIAARTDTTINDMGDGYENVSILQEITQIQMPQIRKLRRDLVLSNTESGDLTSAFAIAIGMIVETCKKLQYLRKIIVVTDARGGMEFDLLEQYKKQIQTYGIEVIFLGVDFDDMDFGFKEENKDPVKAENENVLRQFCEDCGGAFGTLAQAVDELQIPRVKQVRPTPSYKGKLRLGDDTKFETALSIDVERYPKTMVAAAPSASSFVVRNDMESTQATMTGNNETPNDGLAAVKNARTYQVEDDEAPGGKRDVDRDELAKGYEYGRTAVHISESDRNVTTYETEASLDIVGFVDAKLHERSMDMARTNVIIAERTNEKAYMALSSLIHALYELESYAIARFVQKENKEPHMLLLMPSIEPEFECLYDVDLPFAEDIRSYKFPSLDKVVTVSGKVLTLHRNLPSEALQDAMSAYVDSMDLSTFDKDDDGNPTEYAPLEDAFSPKLHRINQVIKHRAVHPDKDPPEPAEILTRFSRPPDDLLQASRTSLASVIKAADVKKVPPKARGKHYGKRETDKPLSDLDIGALLAQDPQRKAKRIDPKNAIAEFKQIVQISGDPEIETVKDAVSQLKKIIFDWITHSVGDSGYQRAVEGIRVMREELVEFEEFEVYHTFLKELKAKVLGGDLGGERREMWWAVRRNKLGLITDREVPASGVGEEEAKEFYIPR